MRMTIPKLRTWHLLGIVAASAAVFSIVQFRRAAEDPGYELVLRLRSLDADVRSGSQEAIWEIQLDISPSRSSIARGIADLGHPAPELRAQAAESLGRIGPRAAKAIPDLARLAESDLDEQVRRAAAYARSNPDRALGHLAVNIPPESGRSTAFRGPPGA